MNELEATRAKLKCLEMVEGTELKWWDVVRYADKSLPKIGSDTEFRFEINNYEFALGVVEGKPVWKGDKLYFDDGDLITIEYPLEDAKYWSWNPPAPKTIMVELPVDTVIWIAETFTDNVSKMCKKALESAKCK